MSITFVGRVDGRHLSVEPLSQSYHEFNIEIEM